MLARLALVVCLPVSVAACVPEPIVVSAPAGVRAVAILPTEIRTERAILVRGEGLVDRVLRRRQTVDEALTLSVREVLKRRGFEIEAPSSTVAPRLGFRIEAWRENLASVGGPTVSVSARLVDPATDATLWEERRTDWRISTLGAETPEASRRAVVETIADAFLRDWRPEPSPGH